MDCSTKMAAMVNQWITLHPAAIYSVIFNRSQRYMHLRFLPGAKLESTRGIVILGVTR